MSAATDRAQRLDRVLGLAGPPCKHECLGDPQGLVCGKRVGAHVCTRKPGHDRAHVACSNEGHATVVWNVLRPSVAVGDVVFLFGKSPQWGGQWELWRVVELRDYRAKVVDLVDKGRHARWYSQARLRYAPLYLGPLPKEPA